MQKDWVQWHGQYDDQKSSLSRRLEVVQRELRNALSRISYDVTAPRLIDLCAGDGRDVLPVLAANERGRAVRARLVELDPRLSDQARCTVADLGLTATVDVRTADAGSTDAFLDIAPAHVVLACGVFGNIDRSDAQRTIATLPALRI